MNTFAKKLGCALGAGLLMVSVSAHALVIGYYDNSRTGSSWGLGTTNTGYLAGGARQALEAAGYELVPITTADTTSLSGIDAFYTGLANATVSASEVAALHAFVDGGGFLFVQADERGTSNGFIAAGNILSGWGVTLDGGYSTGGAHTVGTSAWVTSPNAVDGFYSSAHSAITSAPTDFEILAVDGANRTILGTFESGAGNVLVATNLHFWTRNAWNTSEGSRDLWENIWANAANLGSTNPNPNPVPEPAILALLGIGLIGLVGAKRKSKAA